ncbi:MAG: hypothetical protein G01um101493_78 [Microgenomates group bacterium Gr01-1014_93]|nr:MAG: hypothetical protein G01um101493_78 [Microgenomates group bacterium Gr01-1014_93]
MSRENEGELIRKIKEDPNWSQGLRGRLVDVWFPSYKEYEKFTNHVYDQFNGAGLDLSDLPIKTAVRLSPWLWESVREQFLMRPVTDVDIRRGEERDKRFNEEFEDDGTIFGSEEYMEKSMAIPGDDDGF